MHRYTLWPGVYSFKDEISLLLLYIKDQCSELLEKIKKTEEKIEE